MATQEIMELGDRLNSLTPALAKELNLYLKEVYRIEAPSVPVIQRRQDVAPVPKQPEKTEFDLILDSFDQAKKIGVIKVIREVTNLGLKEAMSYATDLPRTLRTAIPKDEAEVQKKKLELAGAVCSIK